MCCLIKSKIVEKDEEEKGVRSILNFGHTIGHALETLTSYRQYTHGEAVAIGMVAASLISFRIGMCSSETHESIKDLIKKMRLPTNFPSSFFLKDYLKAIRLDKKMREEKIRFVAVEKIGKVKIIQIEPHILLKYLF
jgi:3-dehydroquinate synthase